MTHLPPDDDYDRPHDMDEPGPGAPPQDRPAEQAVLGAMMTTPQAILMVTEAGLAGSDFYFPQHEQVWDAIMDLYEAREPVDMVTVKGRLDKAGLTHKIGGAVYLHDLVMASPSTVNADHYASTVRDLAVRRRLASAADRVRQMAYTHPGDVADVVDAAQAEMFDAVPRQRGEDYQVVGALLDETLEAVESAGDNPTAGLSTGFYDLDDLTGGWLPGQMVVVAGRPGMGKSTIALDFCRSASMRHGKVSAFFSLEMTRQELVTRILSAEAKVPLSKLRKGDLNEEDWTRVAVAMNPVSQAQLYLDDSPGLTMTEIRAKARRLATQAGLDLIVIDYLQLMTSGKRVENRQVEVSEFSRQVKLLAKELRVPVIALSQLNRGPEQRSKRPLISDLRESGSIEQDADIVILMHREDAYEQESSRPGEADIIVAKHRNGPTRDIAVAAQLHYSRFSDLAQ